MPQATIQESLAYALTQAHRQFRDQFETAFRAHGADVEQWWVLKALDQGRGRSMGELADAVLMNHPTLTKLIDRMVSSALVYRVPDPTDRRRVLIFRSERGNALCDELTAIAQKLDTALVGRLGRAETRQLKTLLRGLTAATHA